MELTTVREIFRDREKYLNKEIQVGGWVRSNRDSKAFGFLVLHDGTFFETLQIVYHDTMANFAGADQDQRRRCRYRQRNSGCRLRKQNSPLRSRQTEISVEGASAPDYPLQKKRHSLEYHAYHHPSASQNQHLPGRVPRAFPDCIRHPQILPGERLSSMYTLP